MEKEQIKKAIDSFKVNYKLIEQIKHYEYIKEHFLGCYVDNPINEAEKKFNNYVLKHNSILEREINRIKSIKKPSLSESYKCILQLKALENRKILLVKEHSGSYSLLTDSGEMISASYYDDVLDKDFEKCVDKVRNLLWEYSGTIYPKSCDKVIEKLELKAFNFITKDFKNEILKEIKSLEKSNIPVLIENLNKVIKELTKLTN